jgi:putative colanic acid biosynthesis UDP-glucose lipid carrier transferase
MAKAYNRYIVFRYVIDAPVIGVAYFLAQYFTAGKSQHLFNTAGFTFTTISLFVWYIAASFSRLYADRRSNKFSEEIIFIIYTLILFTILLSSISFFLANKFSFPPDFFTWYLSLLFLLLTLIKYIFRKYLHAAIFQGKLFDNILIYGYTPSALEFYETINKYYYYGYKCVGFLDNSVTKLNGCAYKGKTDNLMKVLQEQPIDEVIIALPDSESQQIRKCIEVCDYLSVKTRIIPDMSQYTSSAARVNNIGLLPVINIRPLPLDKIENKLLKRTYDILFSLLFFITIGIWLMPLIALAVKLTSRGPVLFKQERWGLNNKRITCYKFRTMVEDSSDINQNGTYQQACKGDPRVTRLGSYLRKSSMDELPQFWNVLLGNMSVVGPRPHPTPR